MNENITDGKIVKGIILAGGSGSRLYPSTQVINKQLQIIYDKPMIYYALSTTMLAGIREILIISTPQDLQKFEALLGSGSQWGINLSYEKQEKPYGIAHALIIAEEFIGTDHVLLILGDNIFYGYYDFLRDALTFNQGATVFGYYVNRPERYGVVEFDSKGSVLSIEEKPRQPKSNYAVTGIYIYDNNVIEIAKNIKRSDRGEFEITDVNLEYLRRGKLRVVVIGRGIAWLDAGTHDSILEASHFIATLEKRQGLKFGCPEEVALRVGLIHIDEFALLIKAIPDCPYKKYLEKILSEETKQTVVLRNNNASERF